MVSYGIWLTKNGTAESLKRIDAHCNFRQGKTIALPMNAEFHFITRWAQEHFLLSCKDTFLNSNIYTRQLPFRQ